MQSTSVYTDAVDVLDEFGSLLCAMITEILVDAGIQVHSITSRVKSYDSALRKLSIKSDKYHSVSELTDLLGVRIITYFPLDVDAVAAIIQKEFKIDTQNSVDKRKILSTDRFGYLSLHYVASLNPKRSRLVEYKRFKGRQFELQIRSILQHAWAEIEHDLGYKVDGALPKEVQRRFFRLAGSLELADEEFERLRKEISQYEKRVDATIRTAPQTLPIDQSTIVAALENEKIFMELDQAIAKAGRCPLNDNVDTKYAANEASELKALGIKDIAELTSYAKSHKGHIARFAQLWLSGDANQSPFNRGISLFYLGYTKAAQMDNVRLEKWGHTISGRNGNLLERVRSTWAKVIAELGSPNK